MAINVIVQYNGEFLPDNLQSTQAPIFMVQWHYYRISTALDFALNCLVPWHGDQFKCPV